MIVPSSRLSFSTMWAQQPRFEHDLAAFRRCVAAMGFDAIEVSHSTDDAGLATLLGAGELPLSSLHAPAPRRRLPDGRVNGDANLGAPDAEERRLALDATKTCIDFAAGAGLDRIVIHLGAVGDGVRPEELRLYTLDAAGQRDGEEFAATQDALRRFRAAGIDASLAAARRSLRELVHYASSLGVALGVESRWRYHEIPHPDEALYLLDGYDNAQAGYWHDVGHCEVQARLGLIDRDAWFPRLSARTIGSHLHDVDGLQDHRAPGNGDVDWTYIAAGLPPDALRVFEINQHESDAKVAASIAYLRERGVV